MLPPRYIPFWRFVHCRAIYTKAHMVLFLPKRPFSCIPRIFLWPPTALSSAFTSNLDRDIQHLERLQRLAARLVTSLKDPNYDQQLALAGSHHRLQPISPQNRRRFRLILDGSVQAWAPRSAFSSNLKKRKYPNVGLTVAFLALLASSICFQNRFV